MCCEGIRNTKHNICNNHHHEIPRYCFIRLINKLNIIVEVRGDTEDRHIFIVQMSPDLGGQALCYFII